MMTKSETKALRLLFHRLGGFTGKMGYAGKNAEQINEDTKLWRETWILPILAALIARGEGRGTIEDTHVVNIAAKEGWNI